MSYIQTLSQKLHDQRPIHICCDGFPLFEDEPLQQEHMALHQLLSQAEALALDCPLEQLDPDYIIARAPKPGRMLLASARRMAWSVRAASSAQSNAHLIALSRGLSRQRPQHYAQHLTPGQLPALFDALRTPQLLAHEGFELSFWTRALEEHIAIHGLKAAHINGLKALIAALDALAAPEQTRAAKIAAERMLADLHQPYFELNEPWTDAISAELEAMDEDQRKPWIILLSQLATTSAKPSSRWLQRQQEAIDAVGEGALIQALLRWLPLVGKKPALSLPTLPNDHPEAQLIRPRNEELLRGLVFICTLFTDEAIYAELSELALSAYRKLPELGPRAPKLGNACILSLSLAKNPRAVGYLFRLKLRLNHYASATRQIERALEDAALLHGLDDQELQDLAAPTLGLDADGCWRLEVGDYLAQLQIDAHLKVQPRWIQQAKQGQTQLLFLLQAPTPQEVLKSAPKALAKAHPELVERVDWTAKELEKLLLVQRDRLERLLATSRSWSYEAWRARFIDHPLVCHIAKPLIWCLGQSPHHQLVTWLGDGLVDCQGQCVPEPALDQRVSLWHPASSSWAELNVWRRFIIEHHITQPFKQAFRERFDVLMGPHPLLHHTYALKQHQLAAVAKSQGWEYRLQGRWDSAPDASKPLPNGGMARLWLRPVRDAAFATHQGVYLFVLTESLSFEDAHARPLSPRELEPNLYSELMRDLELFLAVAAIGPDPQLQRAIMREGLGSAQAPSLEASLTLRRDTLRRLISVANIQDSCAIRDDQLHISSPWLNSPLALHIGSGKALNPQQESLIQLDGPTKRHAQTLVEAHLSCPFEPDYTLAHLLRTIAFLIWCEPERGLSASVMRRSG